MGTNPVDDPSKKAGYRLVGDAAYAECKEVASAITPVSVPCLVGEFQAL